MLVVWRFAYYSISVYVIDPTEMLPTNSPSIMAEFRKDARYVEILEELEEKLLEMREHPKMMASY